MFNRLFPIVFFIATVFATILTAINASPAIAGQTAVRWWEPYRGDEATGPQVLGLWKFDGDADSFLNDSSSYDHQALLRGAKPSPNGRFGGCLESQMGYPTVDESHGMHVPVSPVLSPGGAFTVEMWVRGKDAADFPADYAAVLLDMKYVSGNHTGFLFSMTRAGSTGTRQLVLEIGTLSESFHWYSQPMRLTPGVWQHVAFSYDGSGTATFFVNGSAFGSTTQPSAGPMASATRPLSIGDRLGSLYRGFPGFIDEVRISKGVREFRPIRLSPDRDRFVFERMTPDAAMTAMLVNQTGAPLSDLEVTATLPGGASKRITIKALAKGESHPIRIELDSSLKAAEYLVELTTRVPQWGDGDGGHRDVTQIPVVIVPRPLPDRMPVVMWGVNGTDSVVKEIPRLKEIGFTHCLGLRCDYARIWDEGADALPDSADEIRNGRAMLDAALESDLRIVSSLSPGSWLRNATPGKPFLRVNRNRETYPHQDISGLFPQVQQFVFNSGAAMSRAYGDHPAFAAALLHTEVRGDSQVSFHAIEAEAYRTETGAEIPKEVTTKNGVQWETLDGFPENRVIADDNPILRYLAWFWKQGDGWNQLNTQLHDGLKQHSHDGFWTFHDPAVRVPSISGSGGTADVLSHWTYSYPDPVRIGLGTDELMEMARVGGRGQDVMKMTQLIWYRSQTAPKDAAADDKRSGGNPTSPWVDQDPDADYITIAPMHLRESLWWKLSRPIKGIMYHGWQSLVETNSPSAYRFTNPNTKHELQRLIHDVVEPLGPTLLQIPDPPSDVAFLESFSSQMFARRGTYGWNHGWAGEMYHVLMYAQLQPRVLYEESLLAGELAGIKVLVMADCDVLTESVVRAIETFQANGGLIVADAQVCPAIKPDYTLPRWARTKQADKDRAALLDAAAKLRDWLDPQYSRVLDSSNPNVMTRRRAFGDTDYIFAVNDQREFGNYLGGYGMVMEDGLPSSTTIRLARNAGHVYDLVHSRELATEVQGDSLLIPLQLGPCRGCILMVTQRPIEDISIEIPQTATTGDSIRMTIAITDGETVVDGVVPVTLEILDPEGRAAEFSGHYAAIDGLLTVAFYFADNDRVGMWEIRAKELASGKMASAFVRIVAQ